MPVSAYAQMNEQTYGGRAYDSSSEVIQKGYPSVNGFFGERSSKDGFFSGSSSSSSDMFDGASAVPSFEGVSNSIEVNAVPETQSVKYEMQVSNINDEDEVNAESGEQSQETSGIETQAVPESLQHLDNSIDAATREASGDQRIQSAIQASKEIREAIFGKKPIVENVKSNENRTAERKVKEDSVRF